jgi:hypothetical protein
MSRFVGIWAPNRVAKAITLRNITGSGGTYPSLISFFNIKGYLRVRLRDRLGVRLRVRLKVAVNV